MIISDIQEISWFSASLPGKAVILSIVIDFENVTFSYPGVDNPALQQVTLNVVEGEFCLVFGPSGGGKSTLLRCTNGLVPHFSGGKLVGRINIFGLDPLQLSPQGMSRAVGFVFQDPEAQFVVDRVEDEIAFALENLAMPAAEIEERVAASLELLELHPLRTRRLETLSGGEKQRVAIAAALVLRPRLLVLDEPTSQLDPHSAEEVLQALARLNSQLGLTILLAEHRLERVLPFTTQAVYLQAGQPGVIAGEPREVLLQAPINPPVVRLGKALGWRPLPVTVEEARHFASQLSFVQDRQAVPPDKVEHSTVTTPDRRQPFLRAVDLEVSYGSNPALRGVSLELYPGEITALMGPNGSGKTTLLRCLLGLTKPQAGEVWVEGKPIAGQKVSEISRRVGYLPQDPNALLFANTAEEELLVTLQNHGLTPRAGEVSDLLAYLGLSGKALAYPRDLSAGERQRIALGAVLVAKPGALLLDEPTRGLDYTAKRALLELLRRWRGEGMAVLLVTHDVELVAEAADRVVFLESGRVSVSGSTRDMMTKSEKFTPQMARLFPQSMLLTVREVLESLDLKENNPYP